MSPRRLCAVLACLLVPAGAAPAQVQKAQAIEPSGPEPTTAPYTGKPVVAKRFPATPAWSNPFMAPNPFNGVHNDAWQTDAYTQYAGPRGRKPETFSTGFGRVCITLTFDSRGRLEATCTNLTEGPGLYLFDPDTLDTLAYMQLPFLPAPAGQNPATNTTGGAYFYLDDADRAIVATADRRIMVIGQNNSGPVPRFTEVASYDPTPCLEGDDRMPSALPDARGRLWFVGRYSGSVGVLDPKTGACKGIVLHEEIENSFATASDGVYVVSDRAMYKFTAGADLAVKTVWRSKDYRNTGEQKPGQFNAGSGTTPTLIHAFGKAGKKRKAPAFVAVTDNGDPMAVNVYRASSGRLVCSVPVFAKGKSDTENSLISMGRSLFVENNYGYDIQKFNDQIAGGVQIGGDREAVSEPGFARVDILGNGSKCRKVWENRTVRAPSVVPKGDAKQGVIYTFQNIKDPGAASDPWYWTALDARTGKVVWTQLAGWGGYYNNHYAGIAVGPDRTLYLGGVGGVMALRDGG
jgi:hypothetical protein